MTPERPKRHGTGDPSRAERVTLRPIDHDGSVLARSCPYCRDALDARPVT